MHLIACIRSPFFFTKIKRDSCPFSRFSIAKSTGVISVNSKLDRETLANYKLTVRASDKGNPALSTSKDVPIKILDVNDNDPIFTSKQYSGRIAEDAAIGSRVVQVSNSKRLSKIKQNIFKSCTIYVVIKPWKCEILLEKHVNKFSR